MDKMKVGVLGVSGHFTERIIPALKKSNITEIYAIASRSKDRAIEASRDFCIEKAYYSYEELLDDKQVEFVYIPLPNHMHAEWIKKCADAGKHILCEKPFAMNAGEAKEAMNYALGKGIKIAEAFMYKFHPQWRTAIDMLNSGKIGRLQAVHTFFGFYNDDAKNIRNIKETGGGANYDIGCYAISTARLIFGCEPERVIAVKEEDPDFKTDVLTSAMMDFKKGRGLFTVSTKTMPSQRVEIHGTEGVIVIEVPFNPLPEKKTVITYHTKNSTKKIMIGASNQYRILFDEFAQYISGNNKFPVDTNDAVNNMKVIDAVFRSSESGKWEKP